MIMSKKSEFEKLFEGYEGGKPDNDVDYGEDVGRERIWSTSDEESDKVEPSKEVKEG